MTATAADALAAYVDAPTLAEAERALDSLERSGRAAEVAIGDYWDELASLAADEDDYGLAARAQARAIELGCESPTLAREMLGWYLMKDGRRLAGEAEFTALRSELGDEPELLITLGNARSDAGFERDALAAFDEALAAAKRRGDGYAIDRARVERRACREDLELPPDDDDRRAPRPRLFARAVEQQVMAVGWFPRDEQAAAREAWPELEDALTDADGYCRAIEARLRDVAAATGRRPLVAPLRVADVLEHAHGRGLDPGTGEARASLAAALHVRGETLPWPPGRNDPCWCRSGRKYKRCCGS